MQSLRILRNLVLAPGVLALAPAGCHTKPRAHADLPRLASSVRMQDVTFHSASLDRDMPYRVFLPEKIAPGQRLPVVYLLHGGNGSFRDWSNYSGVASYAARGLILVMPEGAFSYYMNAAEKPQDRYQDYFVSDLLSDVETRFPAAQGREHRAVIGISMGGFAAIKLALSRPELFSFVGAFSSPVEVVHRRFNPRLIAEWWRLRTVFGPWGSKSRQSSDPFLLVESADPAVTPYLYLTAGDRELLLEPNRRFASSLRDHHFSYEFHTQPGGHNWPEWNAQILGCFESLFQHLQPAP
jgi:S-formylglutathione hydrolase FrmB